MAECIKNEFDSVGDSQFFEDSIDVVPDGMFLHLEPLSDLTVLQAIRDEADHLFLAMRQQRHSIGFVQVKRLNMGQSVQKMFDIFVTDPDLSPMNCLDALREGFQGMTSIENAPRTVTKGASPHARV